MAGFSIVEGTPRTLWVPLDYTNATGNTVYVGQLVQIAGIINSKNGAIPFVPTATPVLHTPLGIVVGNNNKEPVYNTTYKAEYITSVQSAADQLARKTAGVGMTGGGMFGPNDPQAMVKVAILTPETVVKGRIFNAAYGTALTEAVVTTGASNSTFTCATTGFDLTNIAYETTIYCRSGANRGLYRSNVYDTAAGTAAKTFYGPYWPYTVGVGDKFVSMNCALGLGRLPVDALGTYVNGGVATTTAYVPAVVYEINLETKGEEYVIFTFRTSSVIAVA